MSRSFVRWIFIIVAFVVVLGILRYRPWQRKGPAADNTRTTDGREILKVGYLPVTCHLTCPVTDYATQASGNTRFIALRFTDFPTVVESIKAGRLQAAIVNAPLAMKMREQGVPVKIVYLGHRDGAEMMVRQDLPIHDLRDMRGMTVALPSEYSNQNLVIHKLMKYQGVKPEEIKFVEMPPPDMPGALASKAIDGYFVGEPFAAKAEVDGSGRVLYYAKDIWPNFISCVLVVHEKLIHERPAVVRDLVRGIAESGEWAETHRVEAAKLVSPYFRQDEKLVRYVLTTPPDRIRYRLLTPTDADVEQMRDMGLELGVLSVKTPVSDLVDRSFIPAEIKPAKIDMNAAGQGN